MNNEKENMNNEEVYDENSLLKDDEPKRPKISARKMIVAGILVLLFIAGLGIWYFLFKGEKEAILFRRREMYRSMIISAQVRKFQRASGELR